MKVILGSKSSGRKRMLTEMGYEFEIMSADIDEKAIRLENPKELTLALARAKADALKQQIHKDSLLITSDQVVVWNGEIREKPRDIKEAVEFLRGYELHPAETVTAVVVTNLATGKQAEGVDVAKVYFYPFSREEIDEIIKNKAVFEMAGGFTVDGKIWERHIERIEGARDSVIGLPKVLTERLINEVN